MFISPLFQFLLKIEPARNNCLPHPPGALAAAQLRNSGSLIPFGRVGTGQKWTGVTGHRPTGRTRGRCGILSPLRQDHTHPRGCLTTFLAQAPSYVFPKCKRGCGLGHLISPGRTRRPGLFVPAQEAQHSCEADITPPADLCGGMHARLGTGR